MWTTTTLSSLEYGAELSAARFECPLHVHVTLKLLKLLAKLPVDVRYLLAHWLSAWSKEQLTTLLTLLQECLDTLLTSNSKSSSAKIKSVVLTMEVVWHACILRRYCFLLPEDELLSEEAFHNEQVNKMDLRNPLTDFLTHQETIAERKDAKNGGPSEELAFPPTRLGLDHRPHFMRSHHEDSGRSGRSGRRSPKRRRGKRGSSKQEKEQIVIDDDEEEEEGEEEMREMAFSVVYYPFLLDPTSKANLIHLEAEREQMHRVILTQMSRFTEELFGEGIFNELGSEFLVLEVRRTSVLRDSLGAIQPYLLSDPLALRKPLKVVFRGEPGVDAGGVKKEFFQLLMREVFDPMYGMFTFDQESGLFYFNPDAGCIGEEEAQRAEEEFRLVGIMLGLAIYNMVILDVRFPLAVYKQLLGLPVCFQDLEQLDPTLSRSLRLLLDYQGDDVEDVFGLSFAVNSMQYGQVLTHELIPGGAFHAVTQANKKEYVRLYTQHRLAASVAPHLRAFSDGFHLLWASGALLPLFTAQELEKLVCGSSELKFEDLKESTLYKGWGDQAEEEQEEDDVRTESKAQATPPEAPVIGFFWDSFKAMTQKQKRQLLRFTTGSDRAPIKGLSDLRFIIQKGGHDQDALPSSHTCFNTLTLPQYETKELLTSKLITAIENTEGFHLR
eukprot:g79412.t1